MPVPRPRATTLLASAVVGVYLLVVAGATAAIGDAVAACSSWPLCRPTSGAALVALGHRATAAVVGLFVVATVAVGWTDFDRRTRVALAVALVLYPVQVAVGAGVAVSGATAAFADFHLLAGMGIFAALTLALAWHLEGETATDDDPPGMPERDLPPADDVVRGSPSYDGLVDRIQATALAYARLTKPRLMWLLCLVASAAMALAAGAGLAVGTVVATLGGGVLAIGASGTFNHVLERDVDKRMARTADRPVATHEVPVRNAVAFGLLLAALSLVAFLQVNVLAAALGFVAIVFYSVIYTLVLKPNTVQNTVIGGAAGALPALIGWAAVTGELGLPAFVLAGVIFVWTPSHFYNLALAYRDDYERGGFPMMPVVRGETVTRKHILLWLGATLLSAGALAAVTSLGWLYAGTTVALGGVFLWTVVRLHRERTTDAAFRAFHASNAYLGALLLAVVVDALAV